MRRGDDQNKAANSGVVLLAQQWSDLGLYVAHPAHKLMGNADRWAGEDHVKRAQITARADRHLECGAPATGRDHCQVSVEHLELVGVSQPAGAGVQARAQLQPDGCSVCTKILDRHAPCRAALDSPNRRRRSAQRPGDVHLPQAGRDTRLPEVNAMLRNHPARGEESLVHAV